MARGTTLTNLLAFLKAELRDAQETNTVLDTEYTHALANKQKDLALAYDWSFLKHDWDLTCTAGSRYFAIPTTDTRSLSVSINFERPVFVSRLYNSYYEPVHYGIGIENYNLYEGTGEPQDPIQAWQIVTNVNEASNPNEVEVWPVPVTTQTLRFTGQRNLKALSVAADTADLDDMLLVYLVAADYLAMREQANAPFVMRKAQDHLTKLRAGYPSSTKPYVIGRLPYRERENIKLVAIAS